MNVPASRLDSLGVDAINVGTNGSVPAVEQARTMLENAYANPSLSAPSTIGDLIAQDDSTNNAYQQLANTVILVSLPIAGCTLAAEYASVAQQYPMAAPGAAYYLITAGGILAALGVIAATFPLLARITGPEVARNE